MCFVEEAVQESIICQATAVLDTDGCSDRRATKSTAVSEYEGLIEELRDQKRQIYESLVLGGICRDEYMARKNAVDTVLEQSLQVYEAILSENMKKLPGASSIQAARKALEENTLTRELVDLLIDKILIHPDDRIEIIWKVSGFDGCLAREAVLDVAV